MTVIRTIATFDDRHDAATAERAVTDLVGDGAVRVNDPADVRAARIADTQADTRGASPLGPAPVMTGKTVRSSLFFAVVGAVAGTVLALPVALLLWSGATFGTNLLLAAAIGVAGGGVVGWLAGGYLGGTVSTQPLPVDRGTVVAVDSTTDEVTKALIDAHPIRVEHVGADGQLIAIVADRDDNTQTYVRKLGRAYAGHDEPGEIVQPQHESIR